MNAVIEVWLLLSASYETHGTYIELGVSLIPSPVPGLGMKLDWGQLTESLVGLNIPLRRNPPIPERR